MADPSRFFPPFQLNESQFIHLKVLEQKLQKKRKRWASLNINKNLATSFLSKKDMKKFLQ